MPSSPRSFQGGFPVVLASLLAVALIAREAAVVVAPLVLAIFTTAASIIAFADSGLVTALLAGAGFGVVTTVMGNVVEPRRGRNGWRT